MSRVRAIPGWTKEFLAMKRKGFSDKECCQRAGVSLEKFKTHKQNDGDFDLEYAEASSVGAARGSLSW